MKIVKESQREIIEYDAPDLNEHHSTSFILRAAFSKEDICQSPTLALYDQLYKEAKKDFPKANLKKEFFQVSGTQIKISLHVGPSFKKNEPRSDYRQIADNVIHADVIEAWFNS